MITIFEARKIITMNPSRPLATHVAVRDGRIIGAGSLDELTGWGKHKIDRSFADKVLMPGLVEGHSHVAEGVQWRFVYCGYFDRTDPDGKTWPGVKSIEEVVQRLRAANAKLYDSKVAADRVVARPDLFRQPPHDPAGPRPGLRPRGRSASCTPAVTS